MKTESSFGRLLLSSWKSSYFLRLTTHFASLPFCCVALVDVNLTNMSLSRKDYHTFWKPSLHWCAFCYYQVHDHVLVCQGLPHILQACFCIAQRSRHMCRMSLYRVALVVVDLTRHLITPEGLLSILQADSLLGRLCISPWLCEAGVRQDSM